MINDEKEINKNIINSKKKEIQNKFKKKELIVDT